VPAQARSWPGLDPHNARACNKSHTGSSLLPALHDGESAADRKRDAQRTPMADSTAIDNATQPLEPTMNATLPRTPAVARLTAVFAAAIVTLATLSGIDNLATAEGSAAVVATPVAARAA
jgi:hypothetical protein